MELRKTTQVSKDLVQAFEQLYEEAFPPAEKKPMEFMKQLEKEGSMELLVISKEEQFLGLVILMHGAKASILDYFAIADSLRGGGYGGQVIRTLLERFREKKLILEIERQDPKAENAPERKRRKAFYLRNGVLETGIYANVYDTDFELLTSDGQLTFEEYRETLLEILGDYGDFKKKLRQIDANGEPYA